MQNFRYYGYSAGVSGVNHELRHNDQPGKLVHALS